MFTWYCTTISAYIIHISYYIQLYIYVSRVVERSTHPSPSCCSESDDSLKLTFIHVHIWYCTTISAYIINISYYIQLYIFMFRGWLKGRLIHLHLAALRILWSGETKASFLLHTFSLKYYLRLNWILITTDSTNNILTINYMV